MKGIIVCGFALIMTLFVVGQLRQIRIKPASTFPTFVRTNYNSEFNLNSTGNTTTVSLKSPKDIKVSNTFSGLEDGGLPLTAITNSDANPGSAISIPVFGHTEQDVKIDYQRVLPSDR